MLHNPNAFPNLCKFHPKYNKLEAAWTDSSGDNHKKPKLNSNNMKLAMAFTSIQVSESNELDDKLA
jgi:hypothetical protein